MRVLIVDDTTFMRTTLRRFLEQQHITDVFEAVNGLDGLTKYKLQRPDLVLMDISMPVMDGIEAVKLIKAFDKNANIIICSLQGQKSNVMEAIKSGARSFLVKPIKPEKLLAEIVKCKQLMEKRITLAAEAEPVSEGDAIPLETVDAQLAAQLNELESMTDSEEDEIKSEEFLRGVEAGYLEARSEFTANMLRAGVDRELIKHCVELADEELDDICIAYKLGF